VPSTSGSSSPRKIPVIFGLFDPENKSVTIQRNIGKYLLKDIEVQPKRLEVSSTLL
jgi:hypothetical protein